jgi:hypothetical protein
MEHIPITRVRDRPPVTPPESDSDGSVPHYINSVDVELTAHIIEERRERERARVPSSPPP